MKHSRKAVCLAWALAVPVVATLAACSTYRIDIQQGNVITAEQFALIRLGMTRDQVKYALGTPLLTDVFHDRRWDYIYHFETGSTRGIVQRKLAIWFGKDGKVERVDVDAAALPPDVTGGTRVYDLSAPAGSVSAKADAAKADVAKSDTAKADAAKATPVASPPANPEPATAGANSTMALPTK